MMEWRSVHARHLYALYDQGTVGFTYCIYVYILYDLDIYICKSVCASMCTSMHAHVRIYNLIHHVYMISLYYGEWYMDFGGGKFQLRKGGVHLENNIYFVQ